MVSVLFSGSSGLGLNPDWGHCVVFLGKILYSHSASLHPGMLMGTRAFNAGGNQQPIQRGEEILLVTSCYRTQPDEPLGLYLDLTFLPLP